MNYIGYVIRLLEAHAWNELLADRGYHWINWDAISWD